MPRTRRNNREPFTNVQYLDIIVWYNTVRIYFQQDGAPAHYFSEVRVYLQSEYGDRWIGRGGTVPWPARSPDLTPLDFYLWGEIKRLVYERESETLDELKLKIVSAFETVKSQTLVLIKLKDNLRRRAQLCLQNGGGHFEQLLKYTDLNQDPTLGRGACDHKTVKSTPEKRVWPESNSTPNAPDSSCKAKRLKSDVLATAVEAVTENSEIEMLKDEVAKQTIQAEQRTAELAKQPDERQSVIYAALKLKKERDFYKMRHQQSVVIERRMTAKMTELLNEATNLREFMNTLGQTNRECYSDKVLLEQQLHALQSRVDALQTELEDVKAVTENSEIEMLKDEVAKQTIQAEQRTAELAKQPDERQSVIYAALKLKERDFYKMRHQQSVQSKLASMESYLEELQAAGYPHDIQNACPQCVLNPAFSGVNLNISFFQPQPQLPQSQLSQSQLPQPQLSQPQFPQLSEEMAPIRENKVFTVRKDPNGPIQRLQNRLQIVTQERDCYKEILARIIEGVENEFARLQTEATGQDGSGSCAGAEETQQLKEK